MHTPDWYVYLVWINLAEGGLELISKRRCVITQLQPKSRTWPGAFLLPAHPQLTTLRRRSYQRTGLGTSQKKGNARPL